MASGNIAWKIVGTGSGLLASRASKTMLEKAWAATKGGEPPRNPALRSTTWQEAILWAVLTGAATAIARLLAVRGAASVWESTTGALPPGLEEVGN